MISGCTPMDRRARHRASSQTKGEIMAWFIIQRERKTWTKYLVEAENVEAAFEDDEDWEYLGYLDGDDEASAIVGGPFESKAKALDDVVGYVDG
jgi:hypothetical protein